MTLSLLGRAAIGIGGAAALASSYSPAEWLAIQSQWSAWARPEQLEPGTEYAAINRSDWDTWLYLAGRGTGKSRTGGETCRGWARQYPGSKGALIARTAADVRDVMVSALQTAWRGGRIDPADMPVHEPSKRLVRWPNGSAAVTYSAEEPAALRGPQHDWFWADEIATWQYPEEAWHEGLKMGLRGSGGITMDRPRGIVTTTPRPVAIIRELVKLPTVVITRGSTFDNAANLPPAYIAEMRARYDGTRLGRQELYAEILEDVEGALWNHAMFDRARRAVVMPDLKRVVVAVDPSGSAKRTADEAGICVVGVGECRCLGHAEDHAFVLGDYTGRYSPRDMGEKAVRAYHDHRASRLVGEDNFGGKIIEDLIALIDKRVAYKAVHATRGKLVRAEPVAALYEQAKVHHVALFRELEDECCNYAPLVSTESPGRMDALVWALTDLMLGEGAASFGSLPFKPQGRTFGGDHAQPEERPVDGKPTRTSFSLWDGVADD